MKTLKFKTTINCNGCVASVTPMLNSNKNIEEWKVDIENPDKILIVKTETLEPGDIIESLKKLGYKAETVE